MLEPAVSTHIDPDAISDDPPLPATRIEYESSPDCALEEVPNHGGSALDFRMMYD